jgi:AcrR family transcriptional regulator
MNENGARALKSGGSDRTKRKRHLIVPEIFTAVADAWLKRGAKKSITMEDIAREMGGSTGILYYYFESKGDMMKQMQKYLFDLIGEAVRSTYEDTSATARERLEKGMRAHIKVNCDNWKIARVLWTDYAWDLQPPNLVRVNKAGRTRYSNMIKGLLDEICEAEAMDPSDNKLKVRLFMGMIDQIFGWYAEGKGYTGDQVADLTVGYIMNGFLPAKTRKK